MTDGHALSRFCLSEKLRDLNAAALVEALTDEELWTLIDAIALELHSRNIELESSAAHALAELRYVFRKRVAKRTTDASALGTREAGG